jgi:predicted transcriptional regulator
MRSRRGRLEICLDVLASINSEPDKITSLTTRTGLSYGLAKEVLDKLVNAGLVALIDSTYEMTSEGKDVLHQGLDVMKKMRIEPTPVLKREDIWTSWKV